MKALFRSRFPFVELPTEDLTPDEKAIKKTYEEFYPEKENDRLRDIPVDEQLLAAGNSNKQVKSRGTR